MLFGVGLQLLLSRFSSGWSIGKGHLVQTPIADSFSEFGIFFTSPDFSQWTNPAVFDLGICDIFSVRVAGNVIGTNSLGSLEYAVIVAGAKLVLVMGHTRCGAISSSVKFLDQRNDTQQTSGRPHLHAIVSEIQESVEGNECRGVATMHPDAMEECVDRIAKKNVQRTVREIVNRSHTVRSAIDAGELLVVGAMCDVKTGVIDFFVSDSVRIESQQELVS